MIFLFGFVTFCFFYFLIYPNIHEAPYDENCDRKDAEWFAPLL